MKAIKPSSLARTTKSSSRMMAPPMSSPSKNRSFHSTPQEAAYTRPTTTTHPGYTTQYFTQPPVQKSSGHPYDTRMYSSESTTRHHHAQKQSGSPFDEDIIEELRPMIEQKRGSGKGKSSGSGMRAMHTGKGEEWVW